MKITLNTLVLALSIAAIPLATAGNIIRTSAPIKMVDGNGSPITSQPKPVVNLAGYQFDQSLVGDSLAFDFTSLLGWSGLQDLNAPPAVTWSGSGLPAGLALGSDGKLTGASSQAGAFTFAVTASTDDNSAQQFYALKVLGKLALHTGDLSAAKVGTAYALDITTLAAWDGYGQGNPAPTLQWKASGLPTGMDLSLDGHLSGQPTERGLKTFTLTASSEDYSAQQQYSLKVDGVLNLADATLPSGKLGDGFTYDFSKLASWQGGEGTDALPPVTWVSTSTLPDGLSLSSAGVLSGTPTVYGDQSLGVQAQSTESVAHKTYSFTIANQIGTKPSLANLEFLMRFNGSLAQEGSAPALSQSNGPLSFSTSTPFGDAGQSVNLNGTQGLYASTGPISGTGDYSLGTWVKTTTSAGYLVSQRDADITGEFVLQIKNGAACYWDYPQGNYPSLLCGNTNISDNLWHHVGMVRSSTGVLTIYVDGKADVSLVSTVNPAQPTNGLAIGYDQRDSNNFISGQMRDTFMYSRALSASEWQWLAKNGKPFPAN